MREREDTVLLNCSSVLNVVGFLQDKPPFHTRNSSKPLSFNLKPERAAVHPSTGKLLWHSAPEPARTLQVVQNPMQKLSNKHQITKAKGNTKLYTEYLLNVDILPIALGKMGKPRGCCSKVFLGTRLGNLPPVTHILIRIICSHL